MEEERDREVEGVVARKRRWGGRIIPIIFGTIGLGLLAFGLYAGWQFLQGKGLINPIERRREVGMEELTGPMYPLETFYVNLEDKPFGRILKVGMDFELSTRDLKEEIEKRLPQIRESILLVMSNKTSEEVLSPQGKNLLKEEIISRLNALLTTGIIKNVYFKDFVVQ